MAEKALRHTISTDKQDGKKALVIALWINIIFLLIELFGGIWTNSLALLSDAGHMLTDVLALALALVVYKISRKPPSPKHTYGLLRAEVIGAFVNGATLVGICIFISIGAYLRFSNPPEIKAPLMVGIAFFGLLANLASAYILFSSSHEDLNLRGAFLHMLADGLGSVAAIVAGVVILVSGWTLIDPIASLFIAVLILGGTWGLLRDSIHVLLGGTPKDIDYDEVKASLLELDHVRDIHDLHIWTIASGLLAISCHVEVPPSCVEEAHWPEFLENAEKVLEEDFGIRHITLQLEPVDFHEEKGYI